MATGASPPERWPDGMLIKRLKNLSVITPLVGPPPLGIIKPYALLQPIVRRKTLGLDCRHEDGNDGII
ncbi:MAG: hypothetical protein HKO02_10465 [Hyphomonadaceae bacterium]|nr:hypothetical protein [Hyphomonadaceae bacterium]